MPATAPSHVERARALPAAVKRSSAAVAARASLDAWAWCARERRAADVAQGPKAAYS